MTDCDEQCSQCNRVPVKPASEYQGGGGDPVRNRKWPLGTREQYRANQRLVDSADAPLFVDHDAKLDLEKCPAQRKQSGHKLRRAKSA
jgi:hypothetical protein